MILIEDVTVSDALHWPLIGLRHKFCKFIKDCDANHWSSLFQKLLLECTFLRSVTFNKG